MLERILEDAPHAENETLNHLKDINRDLKKYRRGSDAPGDHTTTH